MAWHMSFSQDKSIILIRPQNKSQKILTRKEISLESKNLGIRRNIQEFLKE